MRIAAILVALVLLTASVLGGIIYYGHQLAHEPFREYAEEEVFFTVEPGETSKAIAGDLRAKGIIQDERLFLTVLWYQKATQRIQAGEYRFSEPSSTFEVIDRLVRGDVYYRSVTVPEGLTLFETAALLAEKNVGRSDELESVFLSPKLIASIDPDATDLEGYLFPDTYQLPRKPTSDEVARAMVSHFTSVLNESRRTRARELDLSPRELVTFASVVEKETGQADERPLIASVFWNRIRIGMALQSDPTIIYDLKRQGRYDGNLRRADLEQDSPYNTYTNRGLPPGPIASPGRDSIDAVLYPAESKYLYFVSKNDGSHHFSKTLREHNAAVRKYQIEYFRNQRRRKRSGTS
jgi:UPF0755 protein